MQYKLKKLNKRLSKEQQLIREERLSWRHMLRTKTPEEIAAMAEETRAILRETVDLHQLLHTIRACRAAVVAS